MDFLFCFSLQPPVVVSTDGGHVLRNRKKCGIYNVSLDNINGIFVAMIFILGLEYTRKLPKKASKRIWVTDKKGERIRKREQQLDQGQLFSVCVLGFAPHDFNTIHSQEPFKSSCDLHLNYNYVNGFSQ